MKKEHNQKNSRPNHQTARTLFLAALVIILLSNTPPAQFFLLESYAYRNADNSFRYSEEPGKGMDFQAGLIQFEGWKKQNPNNPNHTLYRTFRIKPWQFWEWWQYIFCWERFGLSYSDKLQSRNLNK